MALLPVVRYMVLCEDLLVDPANPRRLSIVGLLSTIHIQDKPPFPARCEALCVVATLTEGRGRAVVRIDCVHEETGQRIFASPPRDVQFSSDPLEITAVLFRLQDCPFPIAGVYLIQLWYNDELLAEQPLRLR